MLCQHRTRSGTSCGSATQGSAARRRRTRSGIDERDEHPLNEWVLSTVGSDAYPVFAYCRGIGDRWDERPGTAWGCVFKPKAGERYTASVEIVRPDAHALGYAIKLLIRGGSGLAS